MRVVCISEDAGWDAIECGDGVEKGRIYTVIGECDGCGRFEWWPFVNKCYELAGFPDDYCFPCKMFLPIIENDIDETEIIKQRESETCHTH